MRASKASTEIRQEQIARAALKLLAQRGWRRVSVAAIARQVGVVPSAVYRHYAGKEELLDAVLDLVDQGFQTNVRAGRALGDDPLSQLREVLLHHVDLIQSGVPVPRIILSEDVFAGHPRHRQRVEAIYQAYLGEVSGLLREAQRGGQIRSELTPDTLALIWLGLVQSPAILWLVRRGSFDLRAHCERAWQWFADSMLVPAPSRQSRPRRRPSPNTL